MSDRIELGPSAADERRRLRDQFAAAALTGLLAQETEDWKYISTEKMSRAERLACEAFEIADAMLAVRDGEP